MEQGAEGSQKARAQVSLPLPSHKSPKEGAPSHTAGYEHAMEDVVSARIPTGRYGNHGYGGKGRDPPTIRQAVCHTRYGPPAGNAGTHVQQEHRQPQGQHHRGKGHQPCHRHADRESVQLHEHKGVPGEKLSVQQTHGQGQKFVLVGIPETVTEAQQEEGPCEQRGSGEKGGVRAWRVVQEGSIVHRRHPRRIRAARSSRLDTVVRRTQWG